MESIREHTPSLFIINCLRHYCIRRLSFTRHAAAIRIAYLSVSIINDYIYVGRHHFSFHLLRLRRRHGCILRYRRMVCLLPPSRLPLRLRLFCHHTYYYLFIIELCISYYATSCRHTASRLHTRFAATPLPMPLRYCCCLYWAERATLHVYFAASHIAGYIYYREYFVCRALSRPPLVVCHLVGWAVS